MYEVVGGMNVVSDEQMKMRKRRRCKDEKDVLKTPARKVLSCLPAVLKEVTMARKGKCERVASYQNMY